MIPSRKPAVFGTLRGVALLALSLLLLPGEAWAQGRPPPGARPVPVAQRAPAPIAESVDIEMLVVYATNEGDRVDPELRPVMQQLRFTRYRSFTRLETHPASLRAGEEATFTIAGDRRVKLQLLSHDPEQAKLRLSMFNQEGKLLDTTVSIHRNRSFMVAGPRYEQGVLILPISVSY
ncbi:MAG: hypothetical protein JXX28_09965 [Deltaproteobacteria bacterium]|nr:hypothetical protein [Deltaproteobacteria bacterium]